MRPLLIDHDDSFTFILGQYIGEIAGQMPLIINHTKAKIEEIKKYKPSHIILSPGPGTVIKKQDFAIGHEIIEEFGKRTPILGVCLGHQGIGAHFGAKIIHAPKVMHGKRSIINHTGENIFKNIPSPFEVMRYHSLIIDPKNFPKTLEIHAETNEKIIMGIKHKEMPIFGLQFHPESVGTKYGKILIRNFLKV